MPVNPRNTRQQYMGLGIALGVAIGAALGVAFGNLAMGVGVCIAIGVAFGAAMSRGRQADDGDRRSGGAGKAPPNERDPEL